MVHNHLFFIAQSQKIGIYIVGSSLWWRYMQSKWQIIQPTFSHPLNLLSLLPYPTNTITRTPIPLETNYLT